ncbi:hydroxysteroid 11-beta-dehydrogenase 1-like protein isoform X1 [Mizuhopecten yessoensis]|uniref:Hydroxysteroid 11-beta-dehydrogenase 1-like protein n=2 Tax=Mizuhopecten yessoensis TaxID=6573 RepID=A0A210PW67_MIZYE|nr:hydroxysteroid 11-beta-dehydrogenase 1-like protein isoform X1 [Mizuhopecten yessoensis]XP_021373678.1 hydroxysteroid 11-beta-dehydrogenase 1-like protein isoform X1 [Mizuhopecten yessoensis]XP_021373679.1 hydroxysteroid 11-beta-dehydrogenase 1-like protein isoform X1 [Mizuhopecten yessoensis]OWF40730.1 Hydroxysteroid 11-beta-dehydrogenase 1-like protein [Mizuhopecten yessoensis]
MTETFKNSCVLSPSFESPNPAKVPPLQAPRWLAAMWKKVLAVLLGVIVGYWLIDDFNPDVVQGKRVLITGGSGGIGEQMAYHFARMGASVIVTARRENRLQQVVARCRELGDKSAIFDYIPADMSNLTDTDRVMNEVRARLGGLDYLVLNHIISAPLGLWVGSTENLTHLDKLFDVNFKAYVHLTSHALPLLTQSNGHIIVMSSLSGKIAQPFTIAYSASKFALNGFFNGLRQELKMKNCDISITLCVIGFVGTENAVRELENFHQDFLLKSVPPEDPADAALAVIKGGATGVRELHFPYFSMKIVTILRDIVPQTMELFFRQVYQLNS